MRGSRQFFLALPSVSTEDAVKLLFWVADRDARWGLALMAAMVCAGFVLVGTEGMAREFAEAEEADLQDQNPRELH
jgi:hypothetical protein